MEYIVDITQEEIDALRIALGGCSGSTIYYTYPIYTVLFDYTTVGMYDARKNREVATLYFKHTKEFDK